MLIILGCSVITFTPIHLYKIHEIIRPSGMLDDRTCWCSNTISELNLVMV